MLAAWVPFLHHIAISPMFPISRADIKSEPGAAMSEEEAQKVQKNMKNRRWPQSKHTQAQENTHTSSHLGPTQQQYCEN